MADTVPGDMSTTATMSAGGMYWGNIDTSGDKDWVKITLTAGGLYFFNLSGDPYVGTSLNDPYLQVFNQSGTLIWSDDDGGLGRNSFLGRQATYTGTYYISVGGYSNYTGNYGVSVYQNDVAGDTSTPARLDVGMSVSGYTQAGSSFDNDWYATYLASGYAYKIELVGETVDGSFPALTNPYLQLYSNSGSLITGSDTGSMIYTPTVGVDFYVEAGGTSVTDGGFYSLSITQLVKAATASADTLLGLRYVTSNIDGLAGNDTIYSYGGDDTLKGGSGADSMHGGAGNDTYYVDDAGDIVDEASGGGTDTVVSSVSYTAGDQVEWLVLEGSGSINGTGNALSNMLLGNSGNNVLDGSLGPDVMKGFGGNDTYVVDQTGDVVNETDAGSSGWDTVYSSIECKLGPNLEALVLLGTLKLDGTGNGLGNFIQGNVSANVLKSGGGNDTIRGGGGKDGIDGGKGSDTADYSDKGKPLSISLDGSHAVTVKVKGTAEDSIKNIENLIGGSKADTFKGDSKANSFDGGFGNDVFTGKGGNDKFVFSTALAPTNADTITDFSHKHDKIMLEDYLVSSFLGAALNKAEFYAKAGATRAHDADDRLVYNTSNGKLYIDYDGKGGAAAVLFATLSNHASLDHHDFVIV